MMDRILAHGIRAVRRVVIAVVGATSLTKTVLVGGIQRTIPFVNAECLHVWKSAGTPPPSLPLDTAAKFERLEQATYCTSGY